MSGLTKTDFVAALHRMAAVFDAEMESLCRLDSFIGDGDHGISMARGFRAVAEKLPEVADQDIGAIAGMVGSSLMDGIGGVTGPIFGTVFARLAVHARGKEQLSVGDLARAFRAALDAVAAMGNAKVGDKTMVDALAAAADALDKAAAEGLDMGVSLETASRAAEEGARATVHMRATKGRARYLGERSIGHQDPGATSFALIMQAFSDAYQTGHAARESCAAAAEEHGDLGMLAMRSLGGVEI